MHTLRNPDEVKSCWNNMFFQFEIFSLASLEMSCLQSDLQPNGMLKYVDKPCLVVFGILSGFSKPFHMTLKKLNLNRSLLFHLFLITNKKKST